MADRAAWWMIGEVRRTTLFLLLGLEACSRPPPAQEASKDAGTHPSVVLTDQEDLALIRTSTSPLAYVNGLPIEKDLFLTEYARTLGRLKEAKYVLNPGQRETIKQQIAARYIEFEILRQHGAELGVDVRPDEVEARWAERLKTFGSADALRVYLENSRTTIEELKEEARRNLYKEKVDQALAAQVVVTNDEIDASYKKNEGKYREPERVRLSQILFLCPRSLSAAEKAKKMSLAHEAAAKAKAGVAFAALARKYTEDQDRKDDPDIGWRSPGELHMAEQTAVWNLKLNEVAGPVEIPGALVVVQKTGHKDARTKPLEEVRASIRAEIQKQKTQQTVASMIKAWKDAAAVRVLFRNAQAITSAPTPPASRAGTTRT